MNLARRRTHTDSASAFERMRLILLVPALLDAVVTALSTLVAGGGEPALRLTGALAALVLGGHWLAGYRRGGFRAVSELPEALALLVALLAAPGIPPLPLFGLGFRALYAGSTRSALRFVTWLAILWGTALAHHSFELDDQVGKAAGLMMILGLIHALVKTFLRLDRAESRMRSVIRQSTDVVAIVGPDLEIRWSGTTLRAAGHSLPTLVESTSFLDLFDPADAQLVSDYAVRVIADEADGTPCLVRMRDDRDDQRDVELVLSNQLQDEHIEGLLLTLLDVTERRRLEQERAALEALRERVEAERERQQLEARVQRSQRLVTVGQLAGGVAHDFNNLLSAILNCATLLHDELDVGAEGQQDLADIEDAARRGARLVRQLLHFSKGELTRPELLELNEVVDGLHGMLEHSLGDHVRIFYDLDPDCGAIVADVANAEQVVVNLVINARDAVEPLGGTVRVTTANAELTPQDAAALGVPPGRYACLSAADDGCGMDEATAARALEPFFTTKGSGVGTGLGLTTVAGIVSQAGGCIAIDSRPGDGTTVRVHLPVAAALVVAGAR